MKRVKRVAIVLRMSGTAGRDILTGIFHFTRSNANWRTRLKGFKAALWLHDARVAPTELFRIEFSFLSSFL